MFNLIKVLNYQKTILFIMIANKVIAEDLKESSTNVNNALTAERVIANKVIAQDLEESSTRVTNVLTADEVVDTTATTPSPLVKCQKFGQIFNDVYDCNSYFVCLNDSCGYLHPTAVTCDSLDSQYDNTNQVCNRKEPASNCSINVTIPQCTTSDASVPDPEDPTRYFLCIPTMTKRLIKTHRFCSPNLIFNSEMNLCICNESTTDTCTISMNLPNENESNCLDEFELDDPPFYEESKCTRQGIFSDGYDCNRYYVCVIEKCGHMVKYGLNCPKNMKFDAKRKECSSDPNVKCICTCRFDTFNCSQPGLFPDNNCPSQFYECYYENYIDFFKKRQACPDGTYYNHNCQACTDSPFDKCDSNNKEGSSSVASFEDDVSDSLCEFMPGRFPVKGELDCYYHCKRGRIHKEKCPKNYIFDRQKRICRPKDKKSKNTLKTIRFKININEKE